MKNKLRKFLISLLIVILMSITYIVPSHAMIQKAFDNGKTFLQNGQTNAPNVDNILTAEANATLMISLVGGWLLVGAAVLLIIKLAYDSHVNPASGSEGRARRARQMALIIPIIVAGVLMINARNITLFIIDITEKMLA